MSKLKTTWLILRKGVEKYLVKNFSIYVPSSAGNSKILGFHTKISIITIFPLLSRLLKILNIKNGIINANYFCKQRKMDVG